jgi:hypothetical protein
VVKILYKQGTMPASVPGARREPESGREGQSKISSQKVDHSIHNFLTVYLFSQNDAWIGDTIILLSNVTILDDSYDPPLLFWRSVSLCFHQDDAFL